MSWGWSRDVRRAGSGVLRWCVGTGDSEVLDVLGDCAVVDRSK